MNDDELKKSYDKAVKDIEAHTKSVAEVLKKFPGPIGYACAAMIIKAKYPNDCKLEDEKENG